jgi:type IV pilus assembly protein PilA
LAAVALPAYQDYTTRAKMAEVIVMSSPAKLAVSETASTLGSLGLVTTTNTGYVFPGTTKYVSAIAIAAGGVVTATSTVPNATGSVLLTPTPIGTATGQLRWACTSSISPKYLPAECR